MSPSHNFSIFELNRLLHDYSTSTAHIGIIYIRLHTNIVALCNSGRRFSRMFPSLLLHSTWSSSSRLLTIFSALVLLPVYLHILGLFFTNLNLVCHAFVSRIGILCLPFGISQKRPSHGKR